MGKNGWMGISKKGHLCHPTHFPTLVGLHVLMQKIILYYVLYLTIFLCIGVGSCWATPLVSNRVKIEVTRVMEYERMMDGKVMEVVHIEIELTGIYEPRKNSQIDFRDKFTQNMIWNSAIMICSCICFH